MDGALPSPFPHHSWVELRLRSSARDGSLVSHIHHTAHLIHKASARHSVRWVSRGRETRWDADHRTCHFAPADGGHTTVLAAVAPDYEGVVFCIPQRHLRDIAEADEGMSGVEPCRLLLHEDAILEQCMDRLASRPPVGDRNVEGWKDEPARRLVNRIAEISSGEKPDWQRDTSTFDRRTLMYLVAHIDNSLRLAPCLGEMAPLAGMSPSHFARKFRHSTGLSLHRFINRRRIQASVRLLKDPERSLAHVALDLGFSSQSHFTRLFSDLTGMTPAKYQKQFRRVAG